MSRRGRGDLAELAELVVLLVMAGAGAVLIARTSGAITKRVTTLASKIGD
jgi:hypothetical protein